VSIRRSLISATICIMVPAGYVFGADHGWWGDQPATCQAPGAQTTATAPLRVTTAASVGMTTGEWLRKVDGPRPTKAQMYTAADHVAEGIAAYALAFKAAARNQRQSEYVEKYQQRMYANKLKHLPTNASTCSPCPTAQPNGQPLTVANKATGEALARQAASAAGFRGQALEEAVAVARAESTFNPAAANPTSSARGMWQIMLTAHPGDPDISRWADPYASARMAWRISKGGTDWSPWSVWPSVRGTVGAVQPVAATTRIRCPRRPRRGTWPRSRGRRTTGGAWPLTSPSVGTGQRTTSGSCTTPRRSGGATRRGRRPAGEALTNRGTLNTPRCRPSVVAREFSR
jgi:rubrerythrin